MKAKLDAIRRKPKKFICINDILDHDKSDAGEVLKITKDWYAKMFRKKFLKAVFETIFNFVIG